MNPHLNPFHAYKERRQDGQDRDNDMALETNLARAMAICWDRFAIDGLDQVFWDAVGVSGIPTGEIDFEVPIPNPRPRVVRLLCVAAPGTWTTDARVVPQTPRLDVTIRANEQFVVIEFKTDAHPPDVTQMAVYMVGLGLMDERELPGGALPLHKGSFDAKKYTPAQLDDLRTQLGSRVDVVSWESLYRGLKAVRDETDEDNVSGWLARRASEYLTRIMVPYEGLTSIQRLACGADRQTLRLREHVAWLGQRTLQKRLEERGYTLEDVGARARSGADSDAFLAVSPKNGFPRTTTDLGTPSLVLWFRHPAKDNPESWWGVELYAQASGAPIQDKHYPEKDDAARWTGLWEIGRSKHLGPDEASGKCLAWYEAMSRYLATLPRESHLQARIQPLAFPGAHLKWQARGGGRPVLATERLPGEQRIYSHSIATPEDRDALLKTLSPGNTDGWAQILWSWPVAKPASLTETKKLARTIRKPGLTVCVAGLSLPPLHQLADWLADRFDELTAADSN